MPGGRYPLPSTLLMTVIPAQVAGVKQIRVASPRPAQATLAAAAFLGVREFYRVGGAQAIAALAYGTAEIPRVDKIVGPGNRYVTAAKKLVAFDCAIEFLAGPTEAVIISADGDPVCIASDLVAQAEHDPDALCIFITTARALAKRVQKEVQKRTRANPIAAQSLSRRGAILLVASLDQAVEISNRIVPEHLTLDQLVDLIVAVIDEVQMRRARLAQAADAAREAMWATFAAQYPEVTTGDLAPGADSAARGRGLSR